MSSYNDIKLLIDSASKAQAKPRLKVQSVNEKIEKARTQKIKNDNMVSDQKMKKWSLVALFVFLGLESIAIFVVIFLQGGDPSFYLEEWSFRILVAGTIYEIVQILKIAIKHLFPSKEFEKS